MPSSRLLGYWGHTEESSRPLNSCNVHLTSQCTGAGDTTDRGRSLRISLQCSVPGNYFQGKGGKEIVTGYF